MFSAGPGPVGLPGSVTDCCCNLKATITCPGHVGAIFLVINIERSIKMQIRDKFMLKLPMLLYIVK